MTFQLLTSFGENNAEERCDHRLKDLPAVITQVGTLVHLEEPRAQRVVQKDLKSDESAAEVRDGDMHEHH